MTDVVPAEFESGYFDEMYGGDYDRRNPRYKHRSYLREVLELTAGGDLLDVGCAYGTFLAEAASRFDVHGCDVSRHAVDTAAARVPEARVFRAGVLDVPADRRYDVVTSFDVLEHVPELGRALEHLRSLVRPGGHLVVTMPVYDTPVGRIVEALDRDPTHVHKVSRHQWLEWVAAAGFTIVDWKGILRYHFGGLFYLHWIHRRIRAFSPAILIAARRDA